MSSAGLSRQVIVRRGAYLPHWRLEEAVYHVVFRLADALPAEVLERYRAERAALLVEAAGLPDTEDRLRVLFSERVDRFLDSGQGICWLAESKIAEIVADSLQHFDASRYRLHAWCVMPNHVNVVVQPFSKWDLSKVVHSWKSYTATQANRWLGRAGIFWQKESYDHIVRGADDLTRTIAYVRDNPIQAGLRDWRWVS
jgi:REP element-mobilizing transposase RayT